MKEINNKNLEQILGKYYTKVDYIEDYEDILRCEKHYNKKSYQIFYYDYSMNWLHEDFDIKIYLDLLFSEDYYSHSGYLQWNYYLIFIYNSDDRIEDKIINDIERNEEFALKFVVNYKELDEWLSNRYTVVNEKPAEFNRDLGILWMNKLKKNNLDCLYSRGLNIKECVSYYTEGSPILDQLYKASCLYQRALNIFESNLGKEHLETAITLNEMANLYSQMERYEEALSFFERSLEIFENKLGSNHPYLDKVEQNIQDLKVKMKNTII